MMNSPRKHLALFTYGLAGSGAQWRMLNLARGFAERDYQVDLVVVRASGPLTQALSPAVRLVALGPWWERLPLFRNKKGHWWLMGLSGLSRYLRHEQPVVLLSTSYFSNVVALWARALTQAHTRLVVRISNHLSHSLTFTPSFPRRFQLWSARQIYRWADAIVAVSNGVADDLSGATGLPRERITTIYNPVVTHKLHEQIQEPLNHPWFTLDGPPVLLAAGRLEAQKDFPTLLKAFAQVRAVREARLVILGEGKNRKELEGVARKLGVEAHVQLPGFVMNPFVYMAHAAVFVLSSTYEGLPGVLIQALACGCPVVSTNCPSGPSEILEGGIYGSLVAVGNATELAQAILATLDAPSDRDKLRARAAQFSAEHAVDRYQAVLKI